MEIILNQNIDNLGSEGEVVKVKDGYARNYLIPKGWAKLATKNNIDSIMKEIESKQKKDAKRKYPKCVPRAKANRMTESQRRSAVSRKRSKAQGVGGKPTNVRTFAKRKTMVAGGLV